MELAVKNITKTIKGREILSDITMTLYSGKDYAVSGHFRIDGY